MLQSNDSNVHLAAEPLSKWDPEDQPRNKLFALGNEHLTNSELLAAIIGSGTGNLTALDVARSLINTFDGLQGLANLSVHDFSKIKGIGMARAAQLASVFELAKRLESTKAKKSTSIASPADVAAIYGPLMRGLKREIFRIVLLNTANAIISDHVVSEGGLSASIVESRAVFKRAILENAASLICLHNHPSGNQEPSRQDIAVTKQLVESGKLLGIPVRNHIIIAGKSYTSLAERGHL